MVNGDRIRQARELRGYTQTELARRVGVSQAAIAYAEGGRSQHSDDLLEAIALQTGFPLSFFRQDTTVDFPLGSLLFRRRASMTSAQMTRARRYGQTMFEVAQKLERRLQGPPLRLPQHGDDPAAAARLTRSTMGLSPETPIPNLINAAERSGVLILVLPIPLDRGDAFSVWPSSNMQKPVIVITGDAPGDRLRLSVAHELGHLVMHQAPKGTSAQMEREAYRFAGELLLPEVAMPQEITAPVTLSSIALLKPRWGVSIQAIIRRAHELKIITERQYRYLMEQVGARGWRTREPANLDVPAEKPRGLRQMAELLYGKPIDYQRLAADVNLSTQLVRQIIEAHAGKEQIVRSSAGIGSGSSGRDILRLNKTRT